MGTSISRTCSCPEYNISHWLTVSDLFLLGPSKAFPFIRMANIWIHFLIISISPFSSILNIHIFLTRINYLTWFYHRKCQLLQHKGLKWANFSTPRFVLTSYGTGLPKSTRVLHSRHPSNFFSCQPGLKTQSRPHSSSTPFLAHSWIWRWWGGGDTRWTDMDVRCSRDVYSTFCPGSPKWLLCRRNNEGSFLDFAPEVTQSPSASQVPAGDWNTASLSPRLSFFRRTSQQG